MVKGGLGMNVQKQYIFSLVSNKKRMDNRSLDEFRKVVVENNPIEQAEGSATVTMGDTKVLVGVKLAVGTPFPDTPNEGVLMVGAELSPMAHPDFETGPPGEIAIELARIVDRGIRESHAIDTEKLCIKKGEKVWMVFVDIQPLNHAGNLIDASGLAAIAALINTRMPKLDEDGKIIYEEKTSESLPLKDVPIPITLAKINGHLVVDPDVEEEDAMSCRITISTNSEGNVCAIQKGGSSDLSMEEFEKAMELSLRKGKELRKHLKHHSIKE
jgi:exosome complex component RRP42